MDYLYIGVAKIISYLLACCLICAPFAAVSYSVYDKKTINTGAAAALLFTLFPVLMLLYALFDCLSGYL